MKRLVLTLFLLLFAILLSAQEAVCVTFTSSTENGFYCPFNSVSVTNVTRGWSTDLVYPDTVLMLSNNPLGIGEALFEKQTFNLGDVYPNPFSGETSASLSIYKDCDVLFEVFDSESSILARKRLHLGAGNYRINIKLTSLQLAYLSVTASSVCQVAKLVNTKSGGRNAIDVDYVSQVKLEGNNRTVVFGEFEPGDMMRYEAQLFDNGNVINSSCVTQPQYDDETVTLLFAIDKPSVSTIDVNEITWNSATGVGEVVGDGNAIVTECGICWSISPNPTIECNHAISDTNWGPYKVSMSDLEANTTYYVRSYAVNCVGVCYGVEMQFETTVLPTYSIEASVNLNGGGSVSGAGSYQLGQTCTLHANAEPGYVFVGWTENGNHLGTDDTYTFTVNDSHSLIAHFFPSYDFYEGQGSDYTSFSGASNTDNVYLFFDSLMFGHPDYITKQDLGLACDGQSLYCYEFGMEEGVDKPKIIILCSQHGYEKNSTYGTYYFLKDVAENNGTVPFLNYVYEKLHLIVVPVVNPSGFDVASYKNANGVNLNRNWPVNNWTSTGSPASSDFSGLNALDQPETSEVDGLINLHLDAKLFVDFHTCGAGVLATADHINWISLPPFADTLLGAVLYQLSHEHLDSISSNFKRIYGDDRPILTGTSQLGFVTAASQYGTTGYADVSMSQRDLLSMTFEGFNGFPGDNQPYLPDVSKANSELIGNFLYLFCYYFLKWI